MYICGMEFLPEISLFINLRWLDVLDVMLVALLLYLVYTLIKGTVAVNIFLGILAIFALWRVVRVAEMELLSEILGQFISVGVIALIIVFQPELRQFLLVIGSARIFKRSKTGKRFIGWIEQMNEINPNDIEQIVTASTQMAKTRTGALIIIAQKSKLQNYTVTGETIDGNITARMLQNLFFKNSPLHDGAVIIIGNKIKAAGCVLPLTSNKDFPSNLGLRHRAGLGITEESDAIAVIVSEENGHCSVAKDGIIRYNVEGEKLKRLLSDYLLPSSSK